MKKLDYAQRAVDFFLAGYNCAQSVYAAFCPLFGREEKEALRLSSGFGGGFGRMREVCGAFSGVTLVLGELFGYSETQGKEKDEMYPRVQELGKRFRQTQGSLICAELLKGQAQVGGAASPRTAQFYASRPCAAIVERSAEILVEYLKEEGVL